jgi:membrane fusion protein (multidrug efflux system)
MTKRMILMLSAVLVVVAALGFVKFTQIQAAMAGGKMFSMPPEAVTTIIAKPEHWDEALEATGSVAAVHGVTLSADLPGVVDRIEFQSGARVAAGQTLVTLDTRQERAQLASAEAQARLSKSQFDRSKSLLEQKLIAQSEYDQVAALASQAEAAVNEMHAAISRKTIRAPFAGIAGIRLVNLGQYVHSGDPIVPVQSNDMVYVNFSVPQQEASRLHVGNTVNAAADSGAAASLSGRVTAINPVVDEATRNVQVQATFRNPGNRLRSGSYVTVRVLVGRADSAIGIPVSAINYAPYGSSVFIVEPTKGPDGKTYPGVRQQFVKLGATQGDRVVILSGVKAGEEVVTSGVFKLRPGAAVNVNNKIQPSNSLSPKPEAS